ncbi:MAG TPA: hypothetical protein VGF94_24925 [Kofleriaceae bacterium]|jgi:hypothetical protein
MFRRNELVLHLLAVAAGCGGAEPHDAMPPPDQLAPCCQDLAQTAALSGRGDLAWAYTVLECESPTGANCAVMWQLHGKYAPTQTDALNVLHEACGHLPAACEQLAVWHTQRGHTRAAAAYHKDAGNAHALATDLAAAMHIADAPPRTDAIDQMVRREVSAPVAPPIESMHAKPDRKAWPMHAAALHASADGCSAKVTLDRRPASPSQCIAEVRPLQGDQIALLNRCDQAVAIVYAGTRPNRTAVTDRLRLERYEARSLAISHHDLGPLTFAACPGECRTNWNGHDSEYDCGRQ